MIVKLADDLTSQVFLRLYERLGSYRRTKGAFAPWFHALTRNVLAGCFRKRSLRLKALTELISTDSHTEPGPEKTLTEGETQGDVLAAMTKLGQRERDVLGLKFAFDLSHREIAEMTGLSESNVGVIVFRSLKRLRYMLDTSEEAHRVVYGKQNRKVKRG